jgi:hypothetical protein
MLIGFLLPLLRRFSARVRVLTGVAVMVAGLALVLSLALRGHAPGASVLFIRVGFLLTLAGLAQTVSGARAGGRGRLSSGDDAERPADQP